MWTQHKQGEDDQVSAHVQERMSGNAADVDDTDFTHSKYVSTVVSIESHASDETPQRKADTQCYYLSPQIRVPKNALGLERARLCTHKIPFHFQSHLHLPDKKTKLKLLVNTHVKQLLTLIAF